MPIEENFPIEKQEAKEYQPIPENVYQVELLDINLTEKPKYNQPDVLEKILEFQFVILAGKDKDGNDLRGRSIWRNFVPTYLYVGKNGKNLLYQIIEAFIGREMTQEEEAKLDVKWLNRLITKQVRVGIKNKKKDDKVYNNIADFYAAESQLEALTDQEREEARVKKDEQENKNNTQEYDTEINPEDLPF